MRLDIEIGEYASKARKSLCIHCSVIRHTIPNIIQYINSQ